VKEDEAEGEVELVRDSGPTCVKRAGSQQVVTLKENNICEE
jgi:hypothetical protein